MSRIGRKPIDVPSGVEVKLEGNMITVKGPKGTLTKTLHKDMIIDIQGNVINVNRPSEQKQHKALHGLTRTLVANMVEGVANGFKKELEIQGVGYRCAKQGNDLNLTLGYSHPVVMSEIEGISIEVQGTNKIIISGPDKQVVGQFAANVREKRPPEPYKGKGIRYVGEYVQRKEGKAGKGGKK